MAMLPVHPIWAVQMHSHVVVNRCARTRRLATFAAPRASAHAAAIAPARSLTGRGARFGRRQARAIAPCFGHGAPPCGSLI